MKQQDIALIIVVIVISGIFSFLVSGRIFVTPANRQQKVEMVDVIKSDFVPPDTKYFNKDSINPTKIVIIGDNNNPNPIRATAQ